MNLNYIWLGVIEKSNEEKNGLIMLRSFIFRSTLINGMFVYNIKCIII